MKVYGKNTGTVVELDGKKAILVHTASGNDIIIDYEDWKWVKDVRCKAHIRKGRDGRKYDDVNVLCWDTDTKKNQVLKRYLMDNPVGKQVVCLNKNQLDCRRSNLKVCDGSTKHHYARETKKKGNMKYRGVIFDKYKARYRMYIDPPGGQKIEMYFNTAELAAKAYDALAKHYYGDMAKLNFPERM